MGQLFNLHQQKAGALANAAAQEQQARTGNLGQLAVLTRPQTVQTGGTSSGTSQTDANGRQVAWTYDPLGTALDIGSSAAAF